MTENIQFIAPLISILMKVKSFIFRKKDGIVSNNQTNTTFTTFTTNNKGTFINNGVINLPSSEHQASNEAANTESLTSINRVEPTSENNISTESKQELITTRARNDLNRIMEGIKLAKENITIISVNYVFARNCIDDLINATKRGVKVRLIALNPKGKVVPYFTINTNVSEASKVAQILASYADIRPYLSDNSMIEARYVDTFFSCGCIGIDTNVSCDNTERETPSLIFISPYLYNVGVAQSPVIEFHYPNGINAGNKYAQYIENLWDSAS